MNKIQNSKMAMYGSVEELLKATSDTSGIAGLPAALTALTAKLAELKTLGSTQTQPTEGQTASRDQMLDGLIATTLEIAGIVGAYAHRQELPALEALVDVQRSDFDTARLGQRPFLAQRVHDAAAGVLSSLANPAVTAETLAAFQDQIDAAWANLRQPRMTIVAKRGATENLAAVFLATDALIAKQIDRLVLPLQKTNPAFYAQYQAARTVVDSPGGRGAQPATNATASTVAPVTPAATPVPEQKAA